MRAEDFVRPHLLKLKAYTPIEPFEILAQRLGREAKDIVKLDANENPYGPPPEVLAALGSMSWPNIYPDPESRRLREGLAQWHGVPAEHLLVSRVQGRMRCSQQASVPAASIVPSSPHVGMLAGSARAYMCFKHPLSIYAGLNGHHHLPQCCVLRPRMPGCPGASRAAARAGSADMQPLPLLLHRSAAAPTSS